MYLQVQVSWRILLVVQCFAKVAYSDITQNIDEISFDTFMMNRGQKYQISCAPG